MHSFSIATHYAYPACTNTTKEPTAKIPLTCLILPSPNILCHPSHLVTLQLIL